MAPDTRSNRVRAALFAALATGALLSAFPQQRVGRSAQVRLAPLYDLTASVQGWAMFAPNPGTSAPHLRAELHLADGTVETFDPFVPPRWQLLRDRRWEKVSKEMVSNGNYELWLPLALALRDIAESSQQVLDVVLIRVTNEDGGVGSDRPAVEISTPVFSLVDGILATDQDSSESEGLDQ